MDADQAKPNQLPAPAKGFARMLAAGKYSYSGFKRIILEPAFRQEVFGFGLIMVLFAVVEAGATHYLIGLILFLMLAATEALNTALEYVVDRVSPEVSDFGKHTKDLGSFAVFCMLIANGAFALYVIATQLF
ncbi:MAG: diacylglycerol kinase [Alphaproteobacteria bacterium]